MILYKGEILDDSKQEEIISLLNEEIYKPITEQRILEVDCVINACDKLSKKVKNGKFNDIIEPLIDKIGIENETFENMVNMFSKTQLRLRHKIELNDKELVINGVIKRKRYPLGILLHISAGNVDVLPVYSVVEGLLSGNINILKLPMGDKGVSVKLLKDYIYVFDVPSIEIETLKKLSDYSDAIVV